jgi:hypothetical protein
LETVDRGLKLTHEKGPSDPETAKIDTGVEVMGAPFDGFEDARVPL